MEKSSQINEKDSFLPGTGDSGGGGGGGRGSASELEDSKSLEKDESIKCFGKDTTLTRTQIVTLILITMYFFLASAYYALFAPFLPG